MRKRVLKYFGDNKPIKDMLDDVSRETEGKTTYEIIHDYGDNTVNIFFDDGVDERTEHDVLRRIVGEFYQDIYAEYDVSLSERLFDLLKLKSLKIATAESFTAGNIVSAIIENAGASEVVIEGIVCYSNRSKVDRLKVSEEDIIKEGAVSSKVAYEMAIGLLDNIECGIAIATTGIAGPNSDDTKKPVGLSYIAVGTRKGVHVYKFNLTGNRAEITKKATNNALFLAIQLLKQY
ncbi:MAG: CinA family protein [Clostridia bacterium]|nr:CinA family protein [Clostridia bacterium]